MKPARGRERLERFLVLLIQRRDVPSQLRLVRLFVWLMRQLSHVWRGVVQFRHWLFDNRIFRHHTLGCQVISVGNLTVGGTGKTPVVELLARELSKAGRKVAILSRGYKKVEPGFLQKLANKVLLREISSPPRIVSDGRNLLLDSAMSGDEPYMLASNLPEVAVLVDKNRVKSGRYAISRLGCDTLILDDGFQYLPLKHRVEIVLVDSTNPFGNEWTLPRGTLREPVCNIRRADFIFLTKSDGCGNVELKARLKEINPDAEIIECRHCPRYLKNIHTAESRDLAWLKGLKAVVVSGIAVPSSFEDELERRGVVILAKHRFVDHHRYSQQEIIDIVNGSREAGADAILTTEKDAVRLPKLDRCDVPIYYMRVEIEFLTGAEDFHACISRICFK